MPQGAQAQVCRRSGSRRDRAVLVRLRPRRRCLVSKCAVCCRALGAAWLAESAIYRRRRGDGGALPARVDVARRVCLPMFRLDPSLFGEHGVEIEGATGGKKFLEEIGCKYDVSRKLYRIDQHAAFELLDRVTRYTRIERRKSV